MRVFPLDIVFGMILIAGMIQFLTGMIVYRYRRGRGPLLLVLAGFLFSASSVLWLIPRIELTEIPDLVSVFPLISGVIILFASILIWRERR
jgi:hypothetical protein